MLFRILKIFVALLAIHFTTNHCEAAPAALLAEGKSRQYIAPLPGLVPVYIRPGDTPLEDINLDLAEAFDSYARKHGRVTFPRTNDLQEKEEDSAKDTPAQAPVISGAIQHQTASSRRVPNHSRHHGGPNQETRAKPHTQHIQKISRS